MNRKKIGAALIALSFPVIALSMSVGSANAATVSSTVTAMDVVYALKKNGRVIYGYA